MTVDKLQELIEADAYTCIEKEQVLVDMNEAAYRFRLRIKYPLNGGMFEYKTSACHTLAEAIETAYAVWKEE